MNARTFLWIVAGVLPFAAGTSQAMVVLLDFGATTVAAGTDSLNSPYHAATPSFTDESWNKITSTDLAVGAVKDSTGAITGAVSTVSVKVGEASVSGTKVIDLTLKSYTSSSALGGSFNSGPYANTGPGRDGIFASGGGAANKAVGIQVGGLSAGIYEIYVSARNTSTAVASDYFQYLYAGTGTAGTTFDFTSYLTTTLTHNGTSNSASWVLNGNYVKFTVTVGAGQVLNIASIGEAVGPAEKRGFLNTIEIVSIPEPSAAALAVLGLGAAVSRRRRI